MCRLAIFVLLLLIAWLPACFAAQEFRCDNRPEVVVSAADPAGIEEICASAARAIDFLAKYRLPPKRTIRFEIVEETIDSHGYLAYGCYDSRKDLIRIMSYRAILNGAEDPRMYGEPFDREHYQGAIAHELTHAIFQQHLQIEQPSIAAQEYLAHSAQLAVLPEVRRLGIIKAMEVTQWASGDTISDIYMAIEPGKFAVKSYLHLTALDDPAAFVQLLLNAKWFYIHVP